MRARQSQTSGRPNTPAPNQDDLPPGWVKKESRSKPGAFYYAHPATGRTQVERPVAPQVSGMRGLASALDKVASTVSTTRQPNRSAGPVAGPSRGPERRPSEDVRTQPQPQAPAQQMVVLEEETEEEKKRKADLRKAEEEARRKRVEEQKRLAELQARQQAEEAEAEEAAEEEMRRKAREKRLLEKAAGMKTAAEVAAQTKESDDESEDLDEAKPDLPKSQAAEEPKRSIMRKVAMRTGQEKKKAWQEDEGSDSDDGVVTHADVVKWREDEERREKEEAERKIREKEEEKRRKEEEARKKEEEEAAAVEAALELASREAEYEEALRIEEETRKKEEVARRKAQIEATLRQQKEAEEKKKQEEALALEKAREEAEKAIREQQEQKLREQEAIRQQQETMREQQEQIRRHQEEQKAEQEWRSQQEWMDPESKRQRLNSDQHWNASEQNWNNPNQNWNNHQQPNQNWNNQQQPNQNWNDQQWKSQYNGEATWPPQNQRATGTIIWYNGRQRKGLIQADADRRMLTITPQGAPNGSLAPPVPAGLMHGTRVSFLPTATEYSSDPICMDVRPLDGQVGLSCGGDSQKGLRPENEDRTMAVDLPDGLGHMVGIFDGHRGTTCADFLAQSLPKAISTSIKHTFNQKMLTGRTLDSLSDAEEVELINSGLMAGFETADNDYLSAARHYGWGDGATATVAMVAHGFQTSIPARSTVPLALGGQAKCFVAWSGTGRAILLRGKNGFRFTKDHLCSQDDEWTRLKAAGAIIVQDPRGIWWMSRPDRWSLARQREQGYEEATGPKQFLASSRGFGDALMKEQPAPVLTATPEVSVIDLCPSDWAIVLAGRGVFSVLSDQDVADICFEVAVGMAKGAQEAAQAVTARALARGAKDNVTCIVMRLGWAQPPAQKTLTELLGSA